MMEIMHAKIEAELMKNNLCLNRSQKIETGRIKITFAEMEVKMKIVPAEMVL